MVVSLNHFERGQRLKLHLTTDEWPIPTVHFRSLSQVFSMLNWYEATMIPTPNGLLIIGFDWFSSEMDLREYRFKYLTRMHKLLRAEQKIAVSMGLDQERANKNK